MSQVTEKKEHLSAKDAKDAKKSGRKMTGAANATQSSRPSAIFASFASFAFFASFADKKSSRHDCHPVWCAHKRTDQGRPGLSPNMSQVTEKKSIYPQRTQRTQRRAEEK
jgi:hypothetical protein